MSHCSVLRNYLSAISDNCPSLTQLLPPTHFNLLCAILNLIWECFRNIKQTSLCLSKRNWQIFPALQLANQGKEKSDACSVRTCWKPHLRQQISTGSLCGVTPVVSAWGREFGVPSSPAHQLSSASHLTLLVTWHFWLLFVEFVSWGSHHLHRRRHLQMSPVSFSSSHAGVCEAF